MNNIRNSACTPKSLYRVLNNEYKFTKDAAASKDNALCDSFWTIEQDALIQDWAKHRIWCNPPYSQSGASIEDFISVAIAHRPPIAVFLLPATTSSQWFYSVRLLGEIHLFHGRIQFIPPAGIGYSTAKHDSCLAVLGKESKPGLIRHRSSAGYYLI